MKNTKPKLSKVSTMTQEEFDAILNKKPLPNWLVNSVDLTSIFVSVGFTMFIASIFIYLGIGRWIYLAYETFLK